MTGRNFNRPNQLTLIEQLESRTLLAGDNYEDRGWVSIIVDRTVAQALAPKLDRWKQTLVGDGFTIAPDQEGVLSHTDAPRMNDEAYIWKNLPTPKLAVNRANTPDQVFTDYKNELQDIKDIINADYAAALAAGKTLKVVLVGHPTVPYTGYAALNGHKEAAFPNDLYFADTDGTPTTWGDSRLNFPNPSNEDENGLDDTAHELTTNEPEDGRFDTARVPTQTETFTVPTGENFQMRYGWPSGNQYATDFTNGATASAISQTLDNLTGGYSLVTKTGNTYSIRIMGDYGVQQLRELHVFGNTNELTVTHGVNGESDGGIEVAISRIDMSNLDAAFPLLDANSQPLSNTQVELRLLERYFDRDHGWRTGAKTADNKALIDPISGPQSGLVDVYESVVGDGNVVADTNLDARSWLNEFGAANPTHYLFAHANEGGEHDALWRDLNPGHNPPKYFAQLTSYHFHTKPVRAVFNQLDGSWMGDWNNRSLRVVTDANSGKFNFTGSNGGAPDLFPWESAHPSRASLVRSVLASDGDALISMMAGRANNYIPPMGIGGNAPLARGYPIAENFVERFAGEELNSLGFYNMHGDGTVRMSYVKPVSNVRMVYDNETDEATVTFVKSADESHTDFERYELWQSHSLRGEFELADTLAGGGGGTERSFIVESPEQFV